jgi:hypothetical protein
MMMGVNELREREHEILARLDQLEWDLGHVPVERRIPEPQSILTKHENRCKADVQHQICETLEDLLDVRSAIGELT